MSIIGIILICAFVGVVLWLVNTYVPMPSGIRTVMNIAAVILLIIWLCNITGVWGHLTHYRV